MFARSTTLHGKPENVDAGLRFIEDDVRPILDDIDGCLGLSCLVDRESGQCIVTSSWDSESAMRASDDRLRSVRERARELFGGSMQIDEWEIAVMHRTDHGACCRVTWAQGDDLDRLTDIFKDSAMPALEKLSGFCGASMLLNRSTGMACITATYEDKAALEATRPGADDIRTRSAQESGMEIVEVHEFDLPYAHLHVPELV